MTPCDSPCCGVWAGFELITAGLGKFRKDGRVWTELQTCRMSLRGLWKSFGRKTNSFIESKGISQSSPEQNLFTLPLSIFKIFIHQVGLKLVPRLHIMERDLNKPAQVTRAQ